MAHSSEVKHAISEGAGNLAALLVDDSPLDADLLARHLRHSGYHLSHRRVDSPGSFSEALREKKWDIVLCDYQMPGFGVDEALSILQTSHLDIPFIVVSGAAGEELAVEVMKAGAHDYVLKYRLARLVPAIERERREALARAERAVAVSKLGYLAAIVDSTSEAIIGHDTEGIIATWNSGAAQLFGYSAEEALGKSAFTLFPETCHAQISEALASMTSSNAAAMVETAGCRKDGSNIELALTLSPIRDAAGKVIGVSAIAYNITERKQLEDERKQMIKELNDTLSRVKILSGLLPICASCKKVRDDHGYWQKLETFIHEHSDAEFSHSICPDCMGTLYPQFVKPKETISPPGNSTGMET